MQNRFEVIFVRSMLLFAYGTLYFFLSRITAIGFFAFAIYGILKFYFSLPNIMNAYLGFLYGFFGSLFFITRWMFKRDLIQKGLWPPKDSFSDICRL